MIKKLYLYNFRSYTEVEIPFSPGVNWIVGKNAQGKTNLLEAIYLLSMGRSFRTPQLGQLIQKEKPFFLVEAEVEKQGVSQTIKITFDGETKKMQINATSYTHFTPLLGHLPHVIYAPEDLSLISGMPAFRRKFLDMHLSQIDPLYLHYLARYYRAMRQRNTLLKQKEEETIEPFEIAMSESASYLMQQRKKLIKELEDPLQARLSGISSGIDQIRIQYESSLPFDAILSTLQKNRKKEIFLGTTLYGPHRDEVAFFLSDLPAKSFASAGQKHSIASALRLSQWDHLKEYSETLPFFSVDDFGVHLDRERQENFEQNLPKEGQIFLTSPTPKLDLFKSKYVIEIRSGQVVEVGSA